MWVQSSGQKEPLEKGMATHSSILTWKIPWTEEPGGLQFMGLLRVRHDWAHISSIHGKPQPEEQCRDQVPEVDEQGGNPVYLVMCLKHRGFFTVGNKDVCKVNLWDQARVSRNTGKTPLDQVCRCRAMERALTIHHPWCWQPHWFEGAQTGQIYLGWGVYCRYNNSKWTKNVK